MRFRPVPPQAGHFRRINATPSDLPFKSTGFATYPVPPQFGQSFGATPLPPRVAGIFHDLTTNFAAKLFFVTNHEQESPGVTPVKGPMQVVLTVSN